MLEKEHWSLEVKGFQKLMQLSGIILRAWFLVSTMSVFTYFGRLYDNKRSASKSVDELATER